MDHAHPRPLVIGLTGRIGSGKSKVLQTLVSLGADGIDADQVAHEVIEPEQPAYEAVIAAFGSDLVGTDGRIDRRLLGQRAFADGSALRRLEAIIHPAVIAVVQAQVRASIAPVVVIEAIKLLEAGMSRSLCDKVWVTWCSHRQLVRRLAAGRGMSIEDVRRRLAAQTPLTRMVAQADRVIDTRGTVAETALRVVEGWAELGMPFPRPQVRPGEVEDAGGIAAVLNGIVREGGRTIIDHIYTPARERAFLRRLPGRARLVVAQVGAVIGGFQVLEPYASYTGTMDHVATLGSFVASPLRGQGLGRAMSEMMLPLARDIGFTKLVVSVRADNPGARAFYSGLEFKACGLLTRQVVEDGGYVDLQLYERFL